MQWCSGQWCSGQCCCLTVRRSWVVNGLFFVFVCNPASAWRKIDWAAALFVSLSAGEMKKKWMNWCTKAKCSKKHNQQQNNSNIWLKGFDGLMRCFIRCIGTEAYNNSVIKTLFLHLHISACDVQHHMTSSLRLKMVCLDRRGDGAFFPQITKEEKQNNSWLQTTMTFRFDAPSSRNLQ